MYSATHIYTAKKINPIYNNLFLFGSTFPDISVVGLIKWEEFKSKTEAYVNYLEDNYINLQSFTKGILIHEFPVGIDRFVHGTDGYAYQKGKLLRKNIEPIFGPDPDTEHNFIEFAVEYLMFRNKCVSQKDLEDAITGANSQKNEIIDSISEFFKIEKNLVLASLNQYLSLMNYDLSDKDVAIKWQTKVIKHTRRKQLPKNIIEPIIDKAIEIVEPDYLQFLDNISQKCKTDYDQYLKIKK